VGQDIHKTLEKKNFFFYGTEDTILYSSFDANGGFEPVFGEGMLSFQIV
jgi:7-keto-8-aminopelargonate synthetase-like enzyme